MRDASRSLQIGTISPFITKDCNDIMGQELVLGQNTADHSYQVISDTATVARFKKECLYACLNKPAILSIKQNYEARKDLRSKIFAEKLSTFRGASIMQG